MSDNEKMPHSLMLQNREVLELGGITNVLSFNDLEIVCTSDCGELVIKGERLNVEVLDLDTGDLKITGKVFALVYSDTVTKQGFFKRVFS